MTNMNRVCSSAMCKYELDQIKSNLHSDFITRKNRDTRDVPDGLLL